MWNGWGSSYGSVQASGSGESAGCFEVRQAHGELKVFLFHSQVLTLLERESSSLQCCICVTSALEVYHARSLSNQRR